ncbi:MAG: flavin reductase [Bacteroidota bacterium]|jgi:flavin reductase (DIM6/NTAB) family NADH-FMN oxidoreductase RutF
MKIQITETDLMEMEQRKRAHLINSVGGFKSVCLIGTVDLTGQTNLAIFSSVVHIGANPPLISFIMRPDSVERHTLTNILNTGSYTINHLNETIYKQAHQTSARYPRDISEFDATGLSAEFKSNCKAPFVKESNIQLDIEFKEQINLTINNTIMVIGEIKNLYFPENCLQDDGYLDIEMAGTITCSGLDSYHSSTRIDRLAYAKV